MQTEHYNGNLDRERYDEYAVKLGLSLLFRDKGIRNYRNVESDSVLNAVQRGYFLGLGLGWNNTVWDWRFKGYQHDLLKNVVLFGRISFQQDTWHSFTGRVDEGSTGFLCDELWFRYRKVYL